MTYRELLLALDRDAKSREDGELDMPVVVRVIDDEGDVHIGTLTSAEVDAGCTDEDALVLQGDAGDDGADRPMEGAL